MKKATMLIISVCAIFFGCGSGITFSPPQKKPVISSNEQSRLIREGVSHHDRGEYDQAISCYQKVLEENSGNVEALYEIAYSYYSKGSLQQALDYALQGTAFNSPQLPEFYMVSGNILDDMNRPEDAVKAYTRAIESNSQNHLAYFNLGITESRMGKDGEAKESLHRALRIKPEHPGSNLALGKILYAENNRVAALFPLLRFLVLEPDTKRSVEARECIEKILQGNVTKTDERNYTVSVSSNTPTDEGSFTTANMILGLSAASMQSEKKAATATERYADQLRLVIGALRSGKTDNSAYFTWSYYLPYYTGMADNKMLPAFVSYTMKTEQSSSEETDAMLKWSKNFIWKK
jgi:tetratricopeptide (TPR) repeat protein